MTAEPTTWGALTDAQREAIIEAAAEGADEDSLAAQYGLKASSLRRELRYMRKGGRLVRRKPRTATGKVEHKLLRLLLQGPKTRDELADALNCGPSKVDALIGSLQETHEILRHGERMLAPNYPPPEPARQDYIWPGGDEFCLGHLSDPHYGSVHHQATALNHFADRMVDHGCAYALVSGDITAGQRVYRGQEMDLYAFGADEQVEAACDGLPERRGLTWLLQGGNHDASHFKHGGTNVVKRICDLRDDCVYVGFTRSDIPLVPGRVIRLWHPRGGVAYAKSYRGQKGAEAASADWLRSVVSDDEVSGIVMLQWGHAHYRDLFWHGPMMVFNPGGFEGPSMLGAEKACTPEISGLVSTIRLCDDGWMSLASFQWYSYRPVEDDYRPVKRHNLMRRVKVQPLYELVA